MSRIKINLDALGICASTLCLIHCLAFPLVIAVIPLLRGGVEQPATLIRLSRTEGDCCARQAWTVAPPSVPAPVECKHCAREPIAMTTDSARYNCCSSPFDAMVHLGLLATVAPLGVVAWIAGYRRHKASGVVWLGLIGLGLLVSTLLLGTDVLSRRGEQVMTVGGSICIASAHLWNRRECCCCRWP